MSPINLVIYLIAPYDTFHRRSMIGALGRALLGRGAILCVEPWVRALGGLPQLRQIDPNVYVYRPRVLPHESALRRLRATAIHRRSLAHRLGHVIDQVLCPGANRVAWLYKPEQLWLARLADEDYLVYECYDEYRFDMSGGILPDVCDLEDRLLDAADLVFVTSEVLRTARIDMNANIVLLRNGVDLRLFSSRTTQMPADLARLPRPRIGHVGNLMACLDLELLRQVAARRPQWSFVHIGPVAPNVDPSLLRALPNFHFLGVKPHAELPAYLRGLDAGLVLFQQNNFTGAIDPLKLYEYLAAGLPVVSTRFAPLGKAEAVIWTADNAPEFVECVEDALTRFGPRRKAAGLALAQSRDWSRAAQIAVEALNRMEVRRRAAA